MSNDTELLNTVRGALTTALPEDTPSDVIEEAAREVVTALHAPWFPAGERRVLGATHINLRASPNGTVIGTLAKGTALRAGSPERGWVPELAHGWVSGEMLG